MAVLFLKIEDRINMVAHEGQCGYVEGAQSTSSQVGY